MENIVYHGSSTSGLKVLEPHKSTHGTYVYATAFKEIAVLFAKKYGWDLTYGIGRNNKREPWTIIERVPGAFDVMFNNSFSIYTVDATTFKEINTGFDEVVSLVAVPVLKEEKYPSVYEALKKLEKDGKMKLIFYDKESELTKRDEIRMFENFVNSRKRNGGTFTKYDFEDMLFLHPSLLERINEILLEEDINNQIIKKEDLITILQKKLCLINTGLKNEPFLKNGIREILDVYPELENYVKQSLAINDFDKEKLIKVMLDLIFSRYPNIPTNIKEGIYKYYLQDKRDIKDIAKEIYDYFKRFGELEKLINKDIDENITDNSIILVGPMGVGKSTVSKNLKSLTGMPGISLDDKEQLKGLYAKKDEFLSKKDFELYLTGSVFNNLDKPAIIDFGAGHSIYRTPLAFYEFRRLMKKFKNVVFLVPSEDKEEALTIINERVAKRNQNNGVDYAKINRSHLESPCNDIIATIKVCTKGMNPSEVASEILRRIQEREEDIDIKK